MSDVLKKRAIEGHDRQGVRKRARLVHRRWACEWRRDFLFKRARVREEQMPDLRQLTKPRGKDEESSGDEWADEVEERHVSDCTCVVDEDSEHTEEHEVEEDEHSSGEDSFEGDCGSRERCACCGASGPPRSRVGGVECTCDSPREQPVCCEKLSTGKPCSPCARWQGRCRAVHKSLRRLEREARRQTRRGVSPDEVDVQRGVVEGSWEVCVSCDASAFRFVLDGRQLVAVDSNGGPTVQCEAFEQHRLARQERERARDDSDESDQSDQTTKDPEVCAAIDHVDVHALTTLAVRSSKVELVVQALAHAACTGNLNAVGLLCAASPGLYLNDHVATRLVFRLVKKARLAVLQLLMATRLLDNHVVRQKLFHHLAHAAYYRRHSQRQNVHRAMLGQLARLHLEQHARHRAPGRALQPAVQFVVRKGDLSLFDTLLRACRYQHVEGHHSYHDAAFERSLGSMLVKGRWYMLKQLEKRTCLMLRRMSWLRACHAHVDECTKGRSEPRERLKKRLRTLDDFTCDVRDQELAVNHMIARRDYVTFDWFVRRNAQAEQWTARCERLLLLAREEECKTDQVHEWSLAPAKALPWWSLAPMIANGLLALCERGDQDQGNLARLHALLQGLHTLLPQLQAEVQNELCEEASQLRAALRALLLVGLQRALRHSRHETVAMVCEQFAHLLPQSFRHDASPREATLAALSPRIVDRKVRERNQWVLGDCHLDAAVKREQQRQEERAHEELERVVLEAEQVHEDRRPRLQATVMHRQLRMVMTKARKEEVAFAFLQLSKCWPEPCVEPTDGLSALRGHLPHPVVAAVLWNDVTCARSVLGCRDWCNVLDDVSPTHEATQQEVLWRGIATLALVKGNVQMVQLLHEKIPNFFFRFAGLEALDVAISNEHVGCVRLFVQLGAKLGHYTTHRRNMHLAPLPRWARFCISEELAQQVEVWSCAWAPKVVANLVRDYVRDTEADDFTLAAAIEA